MKSKIFIGTIAGVAILLSAISICMNISEIVVNDISLVLGFIGVLATFIIISNSVQLWKFENKIENHQEIFQDYKQVKKDLERQTARVYNGIKMSILNVVHLELQYADSSTEEKELCQHLNNAFLYLMDIIPILEELYGKQGDKTDETGDNLYKILDLFFEILNYPTGKNTENTLLRIKQSNLRKCYDYMNQFLPNYYFVKKIQILKNKINQTLNYEQKETAKN